MTHAVATLAGGCFWCLETVFNQLHGVESAVSGYMGGHTANPTYEGICNGDTGHAEVVQVSFDPAVISYRELLGVFFTLHDPTQLNRQGNDVGTQYRSAILWHTPEQQAEAQAVIAELTAARQFDAPIVTEVTAATRFYPAEDYHQAYFGQHPNQPYCQFVVAPKVAKAREKYAAQLKENRPSLK
ncbi:MAG TPA: peptide-methionine (S)-S-oxide reductase MsrA [Thiobacillus sp.]|nr:MAG: peptide-methionine (S)-S-oxide reductase [Hydrogenophilales bacterium 16-64-40]OZA33646.1 MAG: peptide-methionine (S)-S-oxide reductase [Hydrogenophilales bacterium 17-64-65]HQS82163.1 peptide-methionine (S)-S-oxide reductase MsrA [Thiobacillus sp.]HQT34746.1 peptide-methionine (S)-S-oxide reductase MsrA [Thiobacillus sp.]